MSLRYWRAPQLRYRKLNIVFFSTCPFGNPLCFVDAATVFSGPPPV